MKSFFILFATFALASPIHERRYDLDHNEIPDWCFTKGDVVSCLLSEASYVWTTFTVATSTQTALTPLSTSVSLTSTSTSLPTSTTSVPSSLPTAALPHVEAFAAQNRTKWTITDVGSIYSSTDPLLGWDNGRTSVLDNTPFWNFGDVLAFNGMEDGFSTGPAFYGTPDDILRVDMKNFTNVANMLLAPPDPSDPVPEEPTPFWGLSTSNVAEVSPGVGVGFVWEVWRDTNGVSVDRGLGMYRATLTEELPVGNRTGPLIAGPDALPVGIMTVFAAEGYIYAYTNTNGTGIVVGRAKTESAFEPDAYEFRKLDGTWVTGIPSLATAEAEYGVEGDVHSDGQGSMIYSNYFKQYMLFTGSYGATMMFYSSATPYGPFDGPYELENIPGYGVNVHPYWSPDDSHKVLYVSSGWNNTIHMYKVEFNY